MTYREGRFWQPDVTVATVVVRDGRLLMVEETVRGARVLNQPAGHLEPDESLLEAALRETLEETGWEVTLTAFIGAYQWKAPADGRHFLRLAFAAEPLRHHPERPLDEGRIASVAVAVGKGQFLGLNQQVDPLGAERVERSKLEALQDVELLQQQEALLFVGAEDKRHAGARRNQRLRDAHKGAHVFPRRRGVHQHGNAAVELHPLVPAERRIARQHAALGPRPADAG